MEGGEFLGRGRVPPLSKNMEGTGPEGRGEGGNKWGEGAKGRIWGGGKRGGRLWRMSRENGSVEQQRGKGTGL